MTDTNRLTDAELEGQAAWGDTRIATMARELLAYRRAGVEVKPGELLPCPFCGGEADTMTPEADDMRAATVMCMSCYCTGKECETEADAVAAWNRRTPPPASRADADLRVALEPFAEFARASSFEKLPDDMPMTQGSRFARRQVTAGDFKRARAALSTPAPSRPDDGAMPDDDDAPEPLGKCEACSTLILEGEPYASTTDGCSLCEQCAPMLSDVIRQMDEALEVGEAKNWFDRDAEELRADRDRIAADIAANGDRKAVQ